MSQTVTLPPFHLASFEQCGDCGRSTSALIDDMCWPCALEFGALVQCEDCGEFVPATEATELADGEGVVCAACAGM